VTTLHFSCATEQFLDFIRKGLVNNHFDAMEAKFTQTGVTTTTSQAGTFGSYNKYKPGCFKEYVCAEPETIKLTKELFTKIQDIKGGQEITIETNLFNNRLNIIESDGSDYHLALTNPEVQLFKLTLAEYSRIGWLPAKKDRPVLYQARFNVKSLPIWKVDKVTYSTNGQSFTCGCYLGGNYLETVQPIEVLKTSFGKFTFFSDHISDILKCFKGNVVFTIYERGMFVTQLHGTHSLMYLASVIPLNK